MRTSENPLISVIIPFHNNEKTLAGAVESVSAQTYENIEILLVCDHPEDDSLFVASELSLKETRIRMTESMDMGLSAARNAGIYTSLGEWIAFVDADDYVSPFYIETLYENAISFDADISMCSYVHYFSKYKQETHKKTQRLYKTPEKIHKFYLTDGLDDNYMWGKLFKRDLFEGVEFPVGKWYEDLSTLPKIIENAHSLYVSNEILYTYVNQKESMVHMHDLERHFDGVDGRLKNAAFYEEHYPSLTKLAYHGVVRLLFYYLGHVARTKGSMVYQEKALSVLWDAKKKATIRSLPELLVLLGLKYFQEATIRELGIILLRKQS